MTTPLGHPDVQNSLLRSAMYEALALAFAYPVPAVRQRLDVLLADIAEFPRVAGTTLAFELEALQTTLAAVDGEQLGVEYNHLLEHSDVCSPFETEYEVDPFANHGS